MMNKRIILAFAATLAIAFASIMPASPALAAPPVNAAQIRGTPVTKVKSLVNLNIRSGPGKGYGVISMMRAGEVRAVIGASDNYMWWKIRCPEGTGWVSASALYSRPVAWRY